jgi:hypothetical protein
MNTQLVESLVITWEPLPDDYLLPDEPVDNLTQPLLAASNSKFRF